LRAARRIGDGLYGVDITVAGGKAYVVEVNDNPNIDAGVEDEVLKDKVYQTIMQEFVARIERLKMPKAAPLPPASLSPSLPPGLLTAPSVP
jgi:predicted ATP-grasp superfamily ATP-dependent carboligase